MIRFILVCIVVIGYLILSIPILLVEWIIGRFSPEKKDISSLRIIQAVFRFILKITGAKITVIGEENVPKDTPVLYIGNHRSYFDILLTYSRCPIRTGYIAKKEMEKIPLLPLYMRDIGCLFLDREDIKQGLSVIKQGTEYMKQGHSMVVFPEGTRNQTDTLLPFREGGYKMAEKSKSPIVPVSICRSDLMLESAPKKRIHSHSVTIEFGKPIYPCELPPKERKERYAEFPQLIQDMYDKNNI